MVVGRSGVEGEGRGESGWWGGEGEDERRG